MTVSLNQLRLDAFLAENPDVDIANRKYLGKWNYKVHFRGDLPRKAIGTFARAIGAEAQWGFDICPTLYFSDLMLHTMARCIVEDTELRQVMTKARALRADASWEERAVYRVLFRPLCRPDREELSNRIEDPEAKLVTERFGLSKAFDGQWKASERVVAVLTDSDETMALLKLAYPGTHAEVRCAYLKWGEKNAAA